METESQYGEPAGDFIGYPTKNSVEALIIVEGPMPREKAISKATTIRTLDNVMVIRTYAQNLGQAMLLILGGLIRGEKLRARDI